MVLYSHYNSFSAPTEVRNLTFSYNDTHFVVSWEEPLEPNGDLNYTISLTGFSLVTMSTVLDRVEVSTELSVAFLETQGAYTRYTAAVVSQTGGGQSREENASFISPQESKFMKYT